MIISGFDLETTGFDGSTDRVVESSFQIWDGSRVAVNESTYANPGVPILNSEIHGITDGMVKDAPPELDVLKSIDSLMQACFNKGIPVVIMNAAFDVTFYRNALLRYDVVPTHAFTIIDPMVIDKHFDKWRPGKRKLEDLASVYGVDMDKGNFHRASFDVAASIRLAWKLIDKWKLSSTSWYHLHGLQRRWYEAQQRSLYEWFVSSGQDDAARTVTTGWPVSEGTIENLIATGRME